MNVLNKSTHLLSPQSNVSDMFVIQLQGIISLYNVPQTIPVTLRYQSFHLNFTNRSKKKLSRIINLFQTQVVRIVFYVHLPCN